jgi:hypothetical protein
MLLRLFFLHTLPVQAPGHTTARGISSVKSLIRCHVRVERDGESAGYEDGRRRIRSDISHPKRYVAPNEILQARSSALEYGLSNDSKFVTQIRGWDEVSISQKDENTFQQN